MLSDLISRLQDALGDMYVLDRELGGGGMSRVFLATERSLNRTVVIKTLPPDLASAVSAQRFKREIDLAAHLQHPHVLPVLGAGVSGDIVYYVMPYVEGESLRHRLRREGKLPIDDTIRILREIADALAYAHKRGVVHRDIKPENILLQEGHAVLADFGVARALTESRADRITSTGISVGTPGYMAPEQLAGDAHVDARADVYALAVVGYELLAGVAPFTGSSAQAVVAAHFRDAPRPLAELRADSPPALNAALIKALAKSPEERIQSAEAFRDALDAITRTAPRRRLSRRQAAVIAGCAILLVGAAAVMIPRLMRHPALDTNLLAVAPFDVLVPELGLWKEGLVDVLSRNLDGMGPLRTVAPSSVVRRWRGHADAESATSLGAGTGARLVVYGGLQPIGRDSVRISATIFDVATSRSVGEVECRDETARVDRLVDSTTVSLLRALGRTRPIGAARLASLGATSLPALREFLQGEQHFRRSQWDSAVVHYERAVAVDSIFALALNHMGQAFGWREGINDSLSVVYKLRAGAHNRGLAPRDSLIILADSLIAGMPLPWSPEHVRAARRLGMVVDQAVRFYPGSQSFYLQGDVYLHFAPELRKAYEDALRAFDAAIADDSAFAPAYIHPVQIGLTLGGSAGGLRYLRPYLALNPDDSYGRALRAVAALAQLAPGHEADARRIVDSIPDNSLAHLWNAVRGWRDPNATEEILLETMSKRQGRPMKPAKVRYFTSRGRLQAALGLDSSRAALAVLDASLVDIDVPRGRELLARLPAEGRGSVIIWAAMRGDTSTALSVAREFDSLTVRPANVQLWPPLVVPYLRHGTAAFVALARHDTAEALHKLETLPDSVCDCGGHLIAVAYARLLERRGRAREALALVRRYSVVDGEPMLPALIVRARLAERLGEREEAIQVYGMLADGLVSADQIYKSAYDESVAALKRLGGDPARRQLVLNR